MSEQITGGLVSIEDGVKAKEEYHPPRKVRVDISFSVPEGTDAVTQLNIASALAANKVAELLSKPKPYAVAAAPSAAQVTLPSEPTAGFEVTPAAEAPKRTRRTKEQIAADEAAAAAKAAPTTEEFDPLAEEEPAASAAEEWDDGLGDITTAPPAEISDADLNSAVQKRNGEAKNPAAIRALIATYNPDPTKVFTLREIKQEHRAAFIAKLADIKPA